MKYIYLFVYLFVNFFIFLFFVESFKFSGLFLLIGLIIFILETFLYIKYYFHKILYCCISIFFLFMILLIIIFPSVYLVLNISAITPIFIFSTINTVIIYLLERNNNL